MNSNYSHLQEILSGNSPEISELRKYIPIIGNSDAHVIIYGEPGTEKQLAGKLIFDYSQRVNELFIKTEATRLNAAFEYEILEPIRNKNNQENIEDSTVRGTLLIDSFENLSSEAKDKLLPIAKKSYVTVDKEKTPVKTDFRIITTTTPDIIENNDQDVLSSELFLLLSALTLKIPSLRNRKQDIPIIFDKTLHNICQETNRPIPPVNFEVYNQLIKHNWPGNTLELENTTRNMILLSSPDAELDVDALPFADKKEHFSKLEIQNLNMAISHLEEELIRKALHKFAGNQSDAAKVLCISEPNLRYKMKKLGLSRKNFKPGFLFK